MVYYPASKEKVEEWVQRYGWDEFLRRLARYIIDEKKRLPYPRYTVKEARADFERLLHMDCRYLWKEGACTVKFESYKNLPRVTAYIRRSMVGAKASGKFSIRERVKTRHATQGNAAKKWSTEKGLFSALSPLRSLNIAAKHGGISEASLFQALKMRSYVPAQFRPTAAKCVYQHFHATRVIDLSGGWGDRLVAAMATPTVRSYTLIDPSRPMHKQYPRMVKLFKRPDQHIALIQKPAEEVDYSKIAPVDLIFTSPPYFAQEVYDEKNAQQSHNKFKTPHAWLHGFLFETVRRSLKRLVVGGHLVLNIADVRSKKTKDGKRGRIEINDPLVQYMRKEHPYMKYCLTAGLQMSKMVGRNLIKIDGAFCEPIMVWKRLK